MTFFFKMNSYAILFITTQDIYNLDDRLRYLQLWRNQIMEKDTIALQETLKCPSCGASVHGAEQYFIDWNDYNKKFIVKLVYSCCGIQFNEKFIKKLPLIIAQKSSCSCGAKLELKNHTFRKVGDEIEFEGVYQCMNCVTKKRLIINGLESIFSNLWKRTKKLELGPEGLKYEKNAEGGDN
jgi:hypothetical protein